MSYIYKILLIIVSCVPFAMSAKENTATLQVADGGKIVIRYDERVDADGSVVISILGVQKKLGTEYSNRLDRIRVLFFDKSGGHSEDEFMSDINTESLMVRSDELSYESSVDGIVWLDEQPQLKLKLYKRSSSLSIPVYMAYYRKKHKYKILAECGTLDIPLILPGNQDLPATTRMGKTSRTITTTEEIEENSDLSDAELAEITMSRIEDLISQSASDRMPEGLDFYVGQLREMELNIRDAGVKSKIASVLRLVENKKAEVAEYASRLRMQEGDYAAAKAEEKEARRNMDYINERLSNVAELSENDVAEMKTLANEMRRQSHSISDPELATEMRSVADRCDAEVKKIDESKKRRNIWMIIGGIFLGVLMFVGNQVFQHFRNIRNQKSISEMQERLAKQARGEAKRRARGMAYNKIAQTKNAIRGKATNNLEKGIHNLTKGKKVSI